MNLIVNCLKKKKKKKHLYDEASTILLYLKYDFIKNIIL